MKKTAIVISGLIAVILACIYVLSYTSIGLRLALKQLPAQFITENQSGNLAEGFLLENVSFTSDTLSLSVRELSVDWRLYSILKGRLIIDDITSRDVVVELAAGSDTGTNQDREISLDIPFDFSLKKLTVHNLSVIDGDSDRTTTVDLISMGLRSDSQIVFIDDLNVDADKFNVDLAGTISLDDMAVDVNALWEYRHDASLIIGGNTGLTGSTNQLDINTVLSSPIAGSINAVINDVLSEPDWQVEVSTSDINLDDYSNNTVSQNIVLFINADGTLQDARIEGSINLTDPNDSVNTTYILDIQPVSFSLDLIGFLSDDPELNATVDWSDITMSSPANDINVILGNGQVSLRYTDNLLHLQTVSDFNYDDLLRGNWNISGAGSRDTFQLDNIIINIEQGRIQGTGAIDKAGEQVLLSGNLEWDDITIPLSPDHRTGLSAGKLSISGDLDNYTINVITDVSLDLTPLFRLDMTSFGNTEQLNIAPFTLTFKDGSLTGDGTINWVDDPIIDIALTGQNLDPGLFWHNWPGSIAIQAGIRAIKGPAEDFSISINELSASGILRELQVELGLSSVITQDNIELKEARLTSGTSTVELNGILGQTGSDFAWTAYIPDLNMLYPPMSGQIDGSGKFSGTRDEPVFSGEIELSNIQSPWGQMDRFYSVFDINLAISDEIELLLDVDHLVYENQQLDKINLTVTGTDMDHNYQMQVAGEILDLRLSGKGAYQDLAWSGLTSILELENADFGKWILSQPNQMQVHKDGFDLSELCMRQGIASFCGHAAWNRSGDWQTRLSSDALPFEMINLFLPDDFSAAGVFHVQVDAEKTANTAVRATGVFNSAEAAVTFKVDANNSQTISIQSLEGQFDLEDGNLDSGILISTAINPAQPLTVQMRMTGLDDTGANFGSVNMDGQIRWSLDDLSFISTLTPRILDVNGWLDIDMAVTGTISDPDLTGKFIVNDASFILPEAGIELTDININGFSNANSGYLLKGSAVSGDGEMQLMANIYELPGVITASVNGDKIEVINLPEIRTLATPDIEIELTEGKTTTRGTVEISDTVIDLDEINATASLSDDVVFTDRAENGQLRPQTSTDTRLQITLGDNIQIRGQGISGKLEGNLDIFTTDRGELLGNGEIRITDGKFSAYGQSLVIEQGRLIYSNNQLDNPELRITAVRNISNGNIRAGITVTGYLSNPVVNLFSTPSMNDDEILAYIVFGRPINTLTSGEGSDLVGAATTMGLQNSGFITRRLSSQFQIDDLQINSDSTGDNAALLIGKYLTPKLYISYVMGLFEDFSTAKIRYDLTNSWSLEATSGADVSVDIYYEIER